jgi:hypothetical protein
MWIIPQDELAFRYRSFFTEIRNKYTSKKYRYFWIYFLGTLEEAAINYSYRLKIIGGGNGKEVIFKGKVVFLDVMRKFSIKTNKDVFILCDVQVESLQVDQIKFEIALYSDKDSRMKSSQYKEGTEE